MLSLRLFMIALGILTCSVVAFGGNSKDKDTKIIINHRAGKITNVVQNNSKHEELILKTINSFDIGENEKVKIVVLDPNPFLFSYKWNGVSKTETDDFKAVQEFAKSANLLSEILTGVVIEKRILVLMSESTTKEQAKEKATREIDDFFTTGEWKLPKYQFDISKTNTDKTLQETIDKVNKVGSVKSSMKTRGNF